MNKSVFLLGFTATLSLTISHSALAQCEPIDFEEFTPGQVATNIVPGVTFTCEPGSCGGNNPLPEIALAPGDATLAVRCHEGCPGASPDSLLMTFDENQSFVQFALGANVPGLDIRVRWYNEFGTPLGTRMYAAGSAMDVTVTIEAGAAIIRSVDVWQINGSFEYVDDLIIGLDTTPPEVEIDAPAFDTCVCGDTIVGIVGSVDDADGTYDCDVAEYRPINAAPGVPWTTFGTACSPFTGTLHSLNTTPLAQGRYYVRVTGTNTCGLVQSDTTVLRIDRSFGSLSIDGFDGGREDGTLCGTVEVLGGVSDTCGINNWQLYAQPPGGGTIIIATGTSGRECVIAEWDTTTVADGPYTLTVEAEDNCGHGGLSEVEVIVDNSGFCRCGPDANGDGVVNFADVLLILANWG